ncbi:M55 family metallopeptidase [Lysinibacillus sp. MHQ-1]|nr:M55 family metallopeptidase [Lysinibacillus sp. MHQ-1]
MKVYISADIEGITGTTTWSETELNAPDYQFFSKTNDTRSRGCH